MSRSATRMVWVNSFASNISDLRRSRMDTAAVGRGTPEVCQLSLRVDDVGGEDVLVVKLALFPEREGGRVPVPTPLLGFAPRIERGAVVGRPNSYRRKANDHQDDGRSCQLD